MIAATALARAAESLYPPRVHASHGSLYWTRKIMAPLLNCPTCGIAMLNVTTRACLNWQYRCVNLDCTVPRKILNGVTISEAERSAAEAAFRQASARSDRQA